MRLETEQRECRDRPCLGLKKVVSAMGCQLMTAPNVVPDAILGINFLKENNVMINLTEGRFKKQRDGFNYEDQLIHCQRTK